MITLHVDLTLIFCIGSASGLALKWGPNSGHLFLMLTRYDLIYMEWNGIIQFNVPFEIDTANITRITENRKYMGVAKHSTNVIH